jgi:IS5 family transposase
MGQVTMENRHGLAVAGMVTQANGRAEREAAEMMLEAKAKDAGHRITAGADKAYDSAEHVAALRAAHVTPHVAQNDCVSKTGKHRKSAIDGRTTRHEGYGLSQTRRKMMGQAAWHDAQDQTSRPSSRGSRFPGQHHRL